jgi:hypothetical protein
MEYAPDGSYHPYQMKTFDVLPGLPREPFDTTNGICRPFSSAHFGIRRFSKEANVSEP